MNSYITTLRENGIVDTDFWENVKITKEGRIIEAKNEARYYNEEYLNKYTNYIDEFGLYSTVYISFEDNCDYNLLFQKQLDILLLQKKEIKDINEKIQKQLDILSFQKEELLLQKNKINEKIDILNESKDKHIKQIYTKEFDKMLKKHNRKKKKHSVVK